MHQSFLTDFLPTLIALLIPLSPWSAEGRQEELQYNIISIYDAGLHHVLWECEDRARSPWESKGWEVFP